VALAERHGLDDRPVVATALGAGRVSGRSGWESSTKERARLRRAWEVAAPQIDPAAAVVAADGDGPVARGLVGSITRRSKRSLRQRRRSHYSQVWTLFATPVVGWLAATQARLGMPDEARKNADRILRRARPDGFQFRSQRARAVICIAEGDPAAALDVLRDVSGRHAPDRAPRSPSSRRICSPASRTSSWGIDTPAATAAEAALAAAEPDRLVFPFAMTEASELLDALPRHETAHGAPARRRRRPAARRARAEHRPTAPLATGGAQPERAGASCDICPRT